MGFSSWLCAKTDASIPAYPYASRAAVLSHVVLVLPDNTKVIGYYDGYGKIHKRSDFIAYYDSEDPTAYGAYQESGDYVEVWEAIKPFLREKESPYSEGLKLIKLVRVDAYKGESFDELPTSKLCPDQGYFY